MDDFRKIDFQKILSSLLTYGGQHAEVYCERQASTSIVCEGDKIEKVISGLDAGIGLRLIKNFKTAYAYTNDFSERSLLSLARDLSDAFRSKDSSTKDITISTLSPNLALPVQIDPGGVEISKKIDFVSQANREARCQNNINQVKVVYRDFRKEILIVNSTGTLTEETRIGTVFLVEVVAKKSDVLQTGYEPVGGSLGLEIFEKYPPDAVSRQACDRANLMLDAERAPGGVMSVVLSSEAGGTMIHEAVGHGLEADLADKNLSVYSNKIGKQVASPLITVFDDSTLPERRGSFVFDDEGASSQKTVLIESGVLVNYMYDFFSAEKAGKRSTGNGRRESYRHKPIPRMTNTVIAPGKTDPRDIISSVDKGLFVKKMGGGQVNTVNGQFVFEVSEGYLIENGKLKNPVRGAILTGSGPEVLHTISIVGSDLGFGIGTCGKDGQGVPVSDAQPTLLIPAITVGGKV